MSDISSEIYDEKDGWVVYDNVVYQKTWIKKIVRRLNKQNSLNKEQILSLIYYSVIIFKKLNKAFSYTSEFNNSVTGSE